MAFIKTSLVRKYWMSATGLFLCIFLIGHLAGNLQLIAEPLFHLFGITSDYEPGLVFNEYAHFMTTNPAVKILSYLTYFSILFHAVEGIILAIKNKKARPQNYAYNKPSANSSWPSRNMALLGSVLLIFIVLHMNAFWAKMHFSHLALDTNGNIDLYIITIDAFTELPMVILYVLCMIVMGMHLNHGFHSAFQSFGLNDGKFTPVIKKVGTGFSIIVPALFAIIPICIYLFI